MPAKLGDVRAAAVVAVASVLLALVAPARSDAHIRNQGGCDANGYCELFFGTTHGEPGSSAVDPINVVFWPYGWNELTLMHREWQWRDQACNSDQWNYRQTLHNQFHWATQNGWRASAGCIANGRWHARGFRGHEHYGSPNDSNNWSVADVHHESWAHNIDRSWQEAEEEARLNAVVAGRPTTANWTYLPRAHGCFQGYCYNGWPAQIDAR